MDFFGRGFKGAKCKTLLRLAMSRIKLLRNKREMQVKGMRKDIANLLQTGQEASARIRVEHIFREQNVMAAYEVIELFCELVVARLPIIESQRQCPLDLKEAISSLIFAAPRCSDLPELLELRGMFVLKYGKDFVASAAELRPDCGVNRRIIEKLSVRAPPGDIKLKLLKEISAEFNVNWDSSESEAELLKQHEDLLDGPSQFISSSQRPLAPASATIRVPSKSSTNTLEADLPSVPVQNPRTNIPPPTRVSDAPSVPSFAPPAEQPAKVVKRPVSPPAPPVEQREEERQFVPFVLPTPPTVTKIEERPQPTYSASFHEAETSYMEYKDVAAAAEVAAVSAERAAAAARAAASLASKSSASLKTEKEDSDSDVGESVRKPDSFVNRWEKAEESSDSDEDGDNHATSRVTKPFGKPQYDGEDEEDDKLWTDRGTVKRTESPPREISRTDSDIFNLNAEERLQPGGGGYFSKSEPFHQPSLYDFMPEERHEMRGTIDIPSYDAPPSSRLPRFDEVEAKPEEPLFNEVEAKPDESLFKRGSFEWQKQNSIPPQRAPPDVPKPANLLRPKKTLSRNDSTGSNSSGGGPSVHPKLPDYEDLAARFQALKSGKSRDDDRL